MALWQREVIGQHLPERLLDLTHQQTGLAAGLLEDPTIGYFADGTAPHVAAVAQPHARRAAVDGSGSDEAAWQWGRIHQAHWRHPVGDAAFDIGPREVDGGSHTLRNTGGELPPHAASSGAEYRIVVDFATPDSFLAVQNIGNSGVPGSPHYQDQFEPWLRGEYHTVHLRREPSKPIARAEPSSNLTESNIQTATPRYSWLAPAARELPPPASANCRR